MGGLKEELPPITTFLNRLLALPIGMQNTLFAAFEELMNARIEAAIAAGTHDAGLETIRAESLVVTDRRTVWKHDSGAETQLFRVQRKDRNKPMSADEAMDADGREIACKQPLASRRCAGRRTQPDAGRRTHRTAGSPDPAPTARYTVSVAELADSHWEEADATRFREAWDAEVAGHPGIFDNHFHLVTGLLLPIWRRLPEKNARVYRLQTDDGERIIGRMLTPIEVEGFCQNLGLDAPKLSADDAWSLVDRRQGDRASGRRTCRAPCVGDERTPT